eukprot:Tbor_TRINITY_DN4411_c0_g1::TRINITY_DN4411_c0_g1_i1::g.7966::m.7966
MATQREIITIAFGNYSNFVATQYVNGNTRYDTEQNVLYFGGQRTKARYPRIVMLDHQHPSKICKELDLNAAQLKHAEDQLGFEGAAHQQCNGRNDIYAMFSSDQLEGEDDAAYAERMFLQNEDVDEESTLYGGYEIAMRIKKSKAENRKRTREEHRIQSDNDEVEQKELNEDDDDDLIPIFQITDPLVPWYRYISSPIHKRSYNLMSSSHTDPKGVSLLHSFGHGLKTVVSGGSHDEHLMMTYDNIRYHLEQSDANQGLQFVCDADGALGGMTWGVIRNIRDECDDKLTTICNATFAPFDISMEDDFATTRSEELILNRALATHYLSDISSLYIPYHIPDWETTWGCPYTSDNAATAQMIAATIDTAFYNSRDGENFSKKNGADVYDNNKNDDDDDDYHNKASSRLPYTSLGEYAFCLRPNKSDKICGAFTALPMQVKSRKVGDKPNPMLPTFSQFLEDHKLLQLTSNFYSNNGPSGFPTCGIKMTYVPLSYGIQHLPETAQGAVHAQVVSLRGVGELEDREYSRSDAMERLYLNDTRCHRSIVTVTNKGYPVSGTFAPAVIGMPDDTKDLRTTFTNTIMGTHMANSNNCGALMCRIVSDVKPIIKCKKSNYVDSYGLEDDEWLDMLEGLEALRDNYDHGDINEGDSDDF